MNVWRTVRLYSTGVPKIRWFYSTDIPVSKPIGFNYKQTERPQKFIPFASKDSDSLETVYQSWKKQGQEPKPVPVNEDQLFDCDIAKMVMRPVYWDGPVYEIRRGLWYKDNTPLSSAISDQLEKHYSEFKKKSETKQQGPIEILSEVSLCEKDGKKWPFKEATDFEKKDKLAVFKDEREAVLIDKESKFGQLQINNIEKLPGQQVLGSSTVTRGYERVRNKEPETASDEKMEEETDFFTSLMKSWTAESSNERFQKDMEADYTNPKHHANSGEREVDHLILCIHGIGQSLSAKFSTVNFAHDCNNMRRQFKQIFVKYPKYAEMAYSEQELHDQDNQKKLTNCKVQVLPIIWRFDVDFSLNKVFEEYDKDGYPRLPTLEQVNIDSITPLRHLAADVVMDILLFYEPKFKEQILSSVVKSANSIYDKYLERHPNFNGKVSLLGHSLGSAICLDILCAQPDESSAIDPKKHLKFRVENFFGLGSPNGVFKLIERHNIWPRGSTETNDPETTSSPKVDNYYNIFYPTDPVAYRVEPLVHPLLADIKPEMISFSDENINSQLKSLAELPNNLINNRYFKRAINFAGLGDYKPQDSKCYKRGADNLDKVPEHVKKLLQSLNRTGRVDYSLPQGYFDIDLINAIGSHIQYFDDPDVIAFLLKQLLQKPKN
ncbi:hypothetical protein OGAPHI_005791 [Ogataea philodendri]|uniref:DDHD domain-containing protein n=1 Tax=Ogataea philodendri TaxID=1378263 RepID=A0A9P8T1V5_9ASCO|nr:uncharacterized protein OGAPHI_005791 [Ogataea philodendri]KAH3662539.1 hypothetical protein OGAPHI_005791 [Ogataea philodendri]